MTGRKITNIVGATIAVIGVAIGTGVNLYISNIRWLPLDQPLRPVPKSTFPFRINYSGSYYIDAEGQRALTNESERNEQHKRLSCLLGLVGDLSDPHACDDTPRAIDFTWELLKDGQFVQRGDYQANLSGGFSTDTIDANFTYFEAKPGNYELRLSGVRLDRSLERYTPHIRVQLDNEYYVGHAILRLEAIILGGVFLIVGLLIVFIGEIRFRRRRHSELANP